jgi:GTPase
MPRRGRRAKMDAKKLARLVKAGDRRALSRAITLVENDPGAAEALLRNAPPRGRAFVLGVTGAPGTGKSTLVGRLVELYAKKGTRVGVLAIDPSSPISGGALLGDRIRMSARAAEGAVYIRSMASRGWTGGLSRAASGAVQLMDAAGVDVVILETVGIGQADVEVVRVAHAVIVVLMPGSGDEVQMSKAGLLEVGDIFVVNKSDLAGAGQTAAALKGAARGRRDAPQVLSVSALSGEGMDGLFGAVDEVRNRFLSGEESIRRRSALGMIVETARGEALARLEASARLKAEALAKLVVAGRMTVSEAAEELSG